MATTLAPPSHSTCRLVEATLRGWGFLSSVQAGFGAGDCYLAPIISAPVPLQVSPLEIGGLSPGALEELIQVLVL